LSREWKPPRSGEEFAQMPTIAGGILRQRCRNLFARYAEGAESAKNPGMRRWALDLAGLPDESLQEHGPRGNTADITIPKGPPKAS
jgi:hypothetical protein